MEEDRAPNGTFTQIPNVFLDTCDLPETAQILFLRLLRHYGHTGGIFTGSTRKLASLVHMPKSTVDRMVKRLRDAKLIKLEYQRSKETEQDIMTVILNLPDLWDTNRHHCKVEPVPIWDNELPQRDGVPQSGAAQSKTGQGAPTLSKKSPAIRINTISNISEDQEASSSTDIKKPKGTPYFMRRAIEEIADKHGQSDLIEDAIERAHRWYQQALDQGKKSDVRARFDKAAAAGISLGVEHFLARLETP